MKWFMIYAPELIIMELSPGNPLDAAALLNWASPRFDEDELKVFIVSSTPGDFLTTKDIIVLRLGKDFST